MTTVGSLFSGVGGIEVGFEKQGFKAEWFIECEPYQQTVLKKHWPEAKVYGDITKVDFRTIRQVEVLVGGFPCQDISQAGKGVGITGDRSFLWKYYAKAIGILRPKYALIENVPMLTQRGLDVVLADLAKIGYDAEWYNLSASTVGAYHRRERIFIISYPNSRGHIHRESKEYTTKTREYAQCKSQSDSKDVSNTNCKNVQRLRMSRGIQKRQPFLSEQSSNGGKWETEPELGRVADGVPNWAHRIKCLGNAVVPQVAEVFARAIKEVEGVKDDNRT